MLLVRRAVSVCGMLENSDGMLAGWRSPRWRGSELWLGESRRRAAGLVGQPTLHPRRTWLFFSFWVLLERVGGAEMLEGCD